MPRDDGHAETKLEWVLFHRLALKARKRARVCVYARVRTRASTSLSLFFFGQATTSFDPFAARCQCRGAREEVSCFRWQRLKGVSPALTSCAASSMPRAAIPGAKTTMIEFVKLSRNCKHAKSDATHCLHTASQEAVTHIHAYKQRYLLLGIISPV